MAGIMAESYQLKWHSHCTHLHSSVATLYRSDNFTDVTLVTCDGRYVAAHRFVLSACSSYLNKVLQITPSNSGPGHTLVIVLPPEISYRTLAILLQYMYSGEATVSNDQLNNVLRAGEILRIKGLYHSKDIPSEGGNVPLLQKSSLDNVHNNSYPPKVSNSTIKLPERCSSASSSVTDGSVHKIPIHKSYARVPKADESMQANNDCKSADIRCENPRDDSMDSSDKGTDDIRIEESMKIELLVKEEPLDWTENDEGTSNSHDGTEVGKEIRIKTENFSDNECDESNMYAPLTCDMCHETFTTPALWVRHIETHPVTDVPRRKRRRNQEIEDGDDDEYPQLRCELCEQVFNSPAEWVRHIQGSHTEEQLAASNTVRMCHRRSTKATCGNCSKTFPSIASMLIHSRTHTGERPYVCDVCDKGFNVKSNLLRHLRTLHDHCIIPDSG